MTPVKRSKTNIGKSGQMQQVCPQYTQLYNDALKKGANHKQAERSAQAAIEKTRNGDSGVIMGGSK